MTSAAVAVSNPAPSRFVVDYRPGPNLQRREPFPACCGERFEDALPVRAFHFEKGLRNFAGWWYFATTATHVGFESWLERDHLMLLDFDPIVRAVASQPFWLRWHDDDGQPRRHAPDFFVRRRDGTAVVLDVRPDERIAERDAQAFAATATAGALGGWGFRRVGALEPVRVGNVRWLSRYRHPRCLVPQVATALREVFARGTGLFAGVAAVATGLPCCRWPFT